MDMPWLYATAWPKNEQCTAGREQIKTQKRHECMTNGRGRNSPAISCPPTCVKHPVWKKLCLSVLARLVYRRFSGSVKHFAGEKRTSLASRQIQSPVCSLFGRMSTKRGVKRSLTHKQYVYIWADGVYFNVRLEDDRLACLVVNRRSLLMASKNSLLWKTAIVNPPHLGLRCCVTSSSAACQCPN